MNDFSKQPKNPIEGEKSPGGSRIIRHGGNDFEKPTIGLDGEEIVPYIKKREEIYNFLFGTSPNVYHEVHPLIPHIDIYAYEPGYKGREFYTLVSSGMSNLHMNVPEDFKGAPNRVELIFYCSEPKQEYLELLRILSHFPHDNKTWFGYGHTIPNGNPPSSIWGSAVLNTILFMPSIITSDRNGIKELKILDDPVDFLWLVPISGQECKLKLEKGMNAVYDLFEEKEHPFIFDLNRESYV